MRLFITGDIIKKGDMDIDSRLSLMEILEDQCKGMKDNMRVRYAQLGGPMGRLLEGGELYNSLSDYMEEMEIPVIIFFNDNFCPVDYVKFLTRHMQNHHGINTGDMQVMRDLAELLVSPEGEKEDYLKLLRYTEKEASCDVERRYKDYVGNLLIKHSEDFKTHYRDKKCPGTICRRMFAAQCINACPAEVAIPGYIELMEHGKMEDAYALMKQANPLSFVCGKICPRPCEKRCKRGELEQTVGVRALQRYAAEMSVENFKEDRAELKNARVAIVGAGPAGLTAAYFLGKTGYEVTIYDANKNPGGMLATGIPEYRLPQATIDSEVRLIENMGVTIKRGIKVGRDIELIEIRENYNAVLLATGCQIGNIIPTLKGRLVDSAVDFLREVKTGKRTTVGKNVLVIGGGDVAMDAARTTKRLGAEVTVASLEKFEKMPASLEEREEAREEGITFKSGYGVDSAENDKVAFRKCLSIFDKGFRFRPVFGEEKEEGTHDHIIFAIGQRADNSYFTRDIEENTPGRVKVCAASYATSAEGVFAAGDMTGVGTAVSAVAEGKKAASSIDKYLGGRGLYLGREVEVPEIPLNTEIWNTSKREEAILSLNERRDSFNEVGTIFTPDKAKCEAMRCMRCDRNSRGRY